MKNALPNIIVLSLGSLLILAVSYAQFQPRESGPGVPVRQDLTVDQYQEVIEQLSSRGYDINVATATASEVERALRYFQSDNNLPVTGVVDKTTLSALGILYQEEFDRAPAGSINED